MRTISNTLCYNPKLISIFPVTGLILLGYLIVFAGLTMLILHDGLITIFTASILAIIGVSLFIFAIIHTTKWRNYFLILTFSAFFIFAYPLSGILIIFFPETIQDMLPTNPSVWQLSLVVGVVGWVSLSLGFLTYNLMGSGTINYRKLVAQKANWHYSWPSLLCLSIVGIFCRAVVNLTFFSKRYYDFYNAIGIIPSIIGNLGLMATFVLLLADSKVLRKTGLMIFMLYIFVGLVNGQRAEAFIPLVMAGIFIILYKQKFSWKLLMGISAVLIILLVTFPLLTKYKILMGKSRLTADGILRIQIARQDMEDLIRNQDALSVSGEEGFLNSFLLLSKRYSHMQYGGQLVSDYVDSNGYTFGASFFDGIIALVPRAIWSDKPTIGLGEIAYKMMGYRGPGSATVPVSADCYINFSWFGVVGCMFFIGYLYAFLNNLLLGRDLLCLALLAFLTYHLMIAGMGVSNIIAVSLINGMGIWAVRRYIVRRA